MLLLWSAVNAAKVVTARSRRVETPRPMKPKKIVVDEAEGFVAELVRQGSLRVIVTFEEDQ